MKSPITRKSNGAFVSTVVLRASCKLHTKPDKIWYKGGARRTEIGYRSFIRNKIEHHNRLYL